MAEGGVLLSPELAVNNYTLSSGIKSARSPAMTFAKYLCMFREDPCLVRRKNRFVETPSFCI